MTAPARILDGKALAADVYASIERVLPSVVARLGRPPGIAVVIVGDDPASHVYVRNKVRAAKKLGFHSQVIALPAETESGTLSAALAALNADRAIDGILLQLPLPPQLDPFRHIEQIDPAKDIDGFHPINIGRAASGLPALVPCTPLGVRELLAANDIAVAGRHVVVIGRGFVVGAPLARLLARKGDGSDATVTICHSRTDDIAAHTRRADIVVAAMGVPRFLAAGMVRPGATVIDVGISKVDDASAPKGSRLVGDVDFDAVAQVAGAITPVPGGVGPMTVAMLMENTLRAIALRDEKREGE